ncbi:MAG: K(+)-transporting ATPase subunit C [Bacillota bacterium]|nr:K(+)-transporting ATPase subunit C [Bacillota bacterium]
MKKIFISSIKLSIMLLLICGLIYPLLTTGIGQVFFNKQANGSIVSFNGKKAGSKLIGQSFTDKRFFQGRVSSVNYNTYTKEDTTTNADGKKAYNGVSSGSSNLAVSNPKLTQRVQSDMDKFLQDHPTIKKEDIPADLLTSSGSGLDPELSPASMNIQIDNVSDASGISKDELQQMISKHTTGRFLGIFGESRVNVLLVNLDIADKLKEQGKL